MSLDLLMPNGTVVDGSGARLPLPEQRRRAGWCRRRRGSPPSSSNGPVTLEDGTSTGRTPGMLVRGRAARTA
jgi:hypothetical protein